MTTSVPAPSPHSSAAYHSDADLDLIESAPVLVVVKHILAKLVQRGVSYRARVRKPEKVQIVKIRSIETSSEIKIVVPSRHQNSFSIRFVEHADRYTTTTPSCIVVRKVDIDCKTTDSNNLAAFLEKEVIPWLEPRESNLKPSLAPMLVLEDTEVCPSPLVAIGFVVEHASLKAEAGSMTATVASRGRKIVREGRKLPDVVLSNNRESLVGRIYVEFHNGDYLFMTTKVFAQQFQFFRSGMIDTSIRH